MGVQARTSGNETGQTITSSPSQHTTTPSATFCWLGRRALRQVAGTRWAEDQLTTLASRNGMFAQGDGAAFS